MSISVVLAISFCFAQHLDEGDFNVEDGLSQSQVTAILQDHQGFMWFGTHNGLNLFDGHDFTIFRKRPGDAHSISANWISALVESKADSTELWIGTSAGLNKYNRATERFEHYANIPSDTLRLLRQHTYDIVEDPGCALWLATISGLARFDPQDSITSHYILPLDNDEKFSTFALALESSSESEILWVASGLGLIRVEYTSETIFSSCAIEADVMEITRFVQDTEAEDALADNLVLALALGPDSTLWIGTRFGGLHRLNTNTFEIERLRFESSDFSNYKSFYPIGHRHIRDILVDRHGDVWFGSFGGGLNQLNTVTNEVKLYVEDGSPMSKVASNYIVSLHESTTGDIWYGTEGSGLSLIVRSKERFKFLRSAPDQKGLEHRSILDVTVDRNGKVWIAGILGLNSYDPQTEHFEFFKPSADGSSGLTGKAVSFVHASPRYENLVWVGTLSATHRLWTDRSDFEILEPALDSLRSQEISAFYEDDFNRLWEGYNGVFRVSQLNSRRQRLNQKVYSFVDLDQPRVHHAPVSFFLGYNDSTTFIGTQRGLLKLTGETLSLVSIDADVDVTDKTSANFVITGLRTEDAIWLGTRLGLVSITPNRNDLKRYLEADGLPNNIVAGVESDQFGRIWVSTFSGFAVMDTVTEVFRVFELHDGLQNYEFNSSAHAAGPGGKLYFGGVSGLNIIDPSREMVNPQPPPLVITDFKIYNQSVPIAPDKLTQVEDAEIGSIPQSVTFSERVVVPPGRSVFSFEFVALDYIAPQMTKYAYKMEGFDDKWIDNGHFRTAQFTNLDPGEYVFRVKGANSDGVWNEAGTSIYVTVLPEWWETSLAKFLYILLAASVLYVGWRVRNKRMQMQRRIEIESIEAEKLKDLDRMKSRFFANISHEFRTPLTLILGPVEKMASGEFKGDLPAQSQVILRNGKRLLRLINQILNLSRMEAGKMALNRSTENIVKLLEHVVSSFESLATRKQIQLQFLPQLPQVFLKIDKNKIEDVVVNLISNALKFTPTGGSVSLQCAIVQVTENGLQNEDQFEIRVSDTGIGIKEDHIQHVFDRYFRVTDQNEEANENREFYQQATGTGIGLAYTRELVELHGGKIQVTSQQDVGTTFTINLPLEEELEAATQQQFEPTALDTEVFESTLAAAKEAPNLIKESSTDASTERILIVEDNRDLCHYIDQSLDQSYSKHHAYDGRDGIARATELMPDLIICDVMMPHVNGYQVCERLKSDPVTSHIPIIMLTALAEDEERITGLEKGADDYLAKPFNARELQTRVRNLISLREKLQIKYRRDFLMEPAPSEQDSMEEAFLSGVCDQINEHLDNPDLSIEMLAGKMHMSRSSLHHKIQTLTGISPSRFVRSVRLKHAAQMLENRQATITEIAYDVGFSSHAYFTTCFKEQFGSSPKEYQSQHLAAKAE